jgi:hypothetical protein
MAVARWRVALSLPLCQVEEQLENQKPELRILPKHQSMSKTHSLRILEEAKSQEH